MVGSQILCFLGAIYSEWRDHSSEPQPTLHVSKWGKYSLCTAAWAAHARLPRLCRVFGLILFVPAGLMECEMFQVSNAQHLLVFRNVPCTKFLVIERCSFHLQ